MTGLSSHGPIISIYSSPISLDLIYQYSLLITHTKKFIEVLNSRCWPGPVFSETCRKILLCLFLAIGGFLGILACVTAMLQLHTAWHLLLCCHVDISAAIIPLSRSPLYIYSRKWV